MKSGDRIFVDTMVIIEAHRTQCWAALNSTFRVETVDTCVVECATGNRLRRGYVPIDDAALRQQLAAIHVVDGAMRNALFTRDHLARRLDAGELDLLACAVALPDAWLLCCSDRAALGCLNRLGFLNRSVSLERIASAAGTHGVSFPPNHTEKWLSQVRTQLLLEGPL